MKNYFPAQGQKYTYLQTNRSDSLGSIWASMGLDFQTDLNTLRLAPRLLVNSNTAALANLGLPIAFEYWDTCIWSIAGTRVFKDVSAPNVAFTEDVSTGAQVNYGYTSDLEVFNSRLWSSTATNLYSKVADGAGGGSWTSRDSFIDGSSDHILTYFPVFNRLYYQSGLGTIKSIDTSDVVSTTDYALILGTNNPISCMVTDSTDIWVGVSAIENKQGAVAAVYRWDGISPVPTDIYPLKASKVLAMCVYEKVVYIVDSNGILSKFTGYAFDEIGRLPFIPPLIPQVVVQKNGMIATPNATFEVLVYNQTGNSTKQIYQNIPSGVWEWSKDFGFTHKYALTYTPAGTTTITDYGQNLVSDVGALFNVSQIDLSTSGRNGSILVGANYFTDASTSTSGIFLDDSNDTVQKKGYFVTTWFFSSEIEDKWDRLWAMFKRLLGATDSIVFKYRLFEEDPVYATITWINTTTFTTTTDITAYSPTANGFNGTTGGEVEILQGTGSATCVHISNIVNNSGTYTVTLDDVVVGVTTGTAKARFQKWIKLFPEITGQIKSWEQLNIGANNTRIQIKGCLTFTGDGEFQKFALFSNSDIKINP